MTSGHNAPDNTCNTTPAAGALTWVLTVSSSSAVTSCLVAILTWPPHCIFAKYCQFTLPYKRLYHCLVLLCMTSFPVSLDFSLDCTLSVCLFGLPPCVSTSPLALLTLSLDLWNCLINSAYGFYFGFRLNSITTLKHIQVYDASALFATGSAWTVVYLLKCPSPSSKEMFVLVPNY